jgi:hypothetical protein
MAVVINGSAGVTVNSGAVLGITSGTAVASTSGTSIDFTSIPSWVKRITVMFNSTSINGSAGIIVQAGAGSVTTSGYSGAYGYFINGGASVVAALTTGFGAYHNQAAASVQVGMLTITNVSGNIWVSSMNGANTDSNTCYGGSGVVTLGGTLDRIRITTSSGTPTFDAGSINILYE